MYTNEWDPLQHSIGELSQEVLSSVRKRQIKNILKSYVGAFDPFSEMIQNAMDAVDNRDIYSEEDKIEKKIWLTINLKENRFSITDNGIGFKKDEFYSFLAPDISFKDGESTRGNKGVGATYLAYAFNNLQIGTKTPDFSFTGQMKEGRDWVEDSKGIVERPKIKYVGVYKSLGRIGLSKWRIQQSID